MTFKEYEPISTYNWILTILALGVPILNLLLVSYWALSRRSHPSKKNFARAFLFILTIIAIAYAGVFFTLLK